MNAPITLNRAILRGTQGLGLSIDANELSRLATKADAYALCGEHDLYRATLDLIAERLEAMAPLAALIRAEIEQRHTQKEAA